MTIAELINSIIDSSKERVKTPITGAFICSFVVYNWRPLFLLMFSDASMEDKIVVINNEYCNKGAIIAPLIIALIYTIFVPFIMIVIDSILVFAKKQRVANIYQNKTNILEEKIVMAAKVLELKNAESGNKEKQELLDKITYIEETNVQLTASHKNVVEQLNSALKQANETLEVSITENEKNLQMLKEMRDSPDVSFLAKQTAELQKKGKKVYEKLTPAQRRNFETVAKSDGTINELLLDADDINELADLNLVAGSTKDSSWVLTDTGRHLYFYLVFNTPNH